MGAVLGLLILVFCSGFIGTWRGRFHPAEGTGLAAILSLGAFGWISYMLGLAGLGHADAVRGFAILFAVGLGFGLAFWKGNRWAWPKFESSSSSKFLIPVALLLWLLFPVLKSFSPSDSTDWDTLAYHLAVPKIWLQEGRITEIPFIHHSYFPFVVDGAFYGLLPWGEADAKMVTSWFLLFGGVWLYGLSRRVFPNAPAMLPVFGLGLTPLVLWSSGSGYIDVAHGFFAAISLWYLAEGWFKDRSMLWIAGAALGFALASKYTGLQLSLAMLVGLVGAVVFRRDLGGTPIRTMALGGLVSLLIACPWYVRSAVTTGNPVYPFFLGGKYWSPERAVIYKDEQQTFGVGRTESGRNPLEIPHAVLGLAYQPGRYINPAQTVGGGFPMGAAGVVVFLGFFGALLFRIRDPQTRFILAVVTVYALQWFFLSQQVRYFTSVFPLGALWLAALWQMSKFRGLMTAAVTLQGAYAIWLISQVQTLPQLQVALGTVGREEYIRANLPFSESAKSLNELPEGSKIALYDEVFGYFLDRKYFWANPGHCNLLDVNGDDPTGSGLINAMKQREISHIYVSLSVPGAPFRTELAQAWFTGQPLPSDLVEQYQGAFQTRWIAQLEAAYQRGLIRLMPPLSENPRAVLFEIVP